MELQHQFDTLHRSVAILVKEEYARVIDEDIDDIAFRLAPIVQLLRRVGQAQVRKVRVRLHTILRGEISGYFLQFLLLVAYQQQVTVIVTRQLGRILQADTTTCARY